MGFAHCICPKFSVQIKIYHTTNINPSKNQEEYEGGDFFTPGVTQGAIVSQMALLWTLLFAQCDAFALFTNKGGFSTCARVNLITVMGLKIY